MQLVSAPLRLVLPCSGRPITHWLHGLRLFHRNTEGSTMDERYEQTKTKVETWAKAKPWVAMAAGIAVGFFLHMLLF